MRWLGAALLVGVVMAAGACAAPAPGAAGSSTDASVDDPWPGRYRYFSTSVTQGGRDHHLVGAVFLEVNLLEVGKVSAYAGCNRLFMSVRLAGGRMLVDTVSSTKKGCAPDLHAQDTWLGKFFEADPNMSTTGPELVLTNDDVEITLRADLSPS